MQHDLKNTQSQSHKIQQPQSHKIHSLGLSVSQNTSVSVSQKYNTVSKVLKTCDAPVMAEVMLVDREGANVQLLLFCELLLRDGAAATNLHRIGVAARRSFCATTKLLRDDEAVARRRRRRLVGRRRRKRGCEGRKLGAVGVLVSWNGDWSGSGAN
ncbi:1,4-dihydroxy-6-naphthoate synthase [Sesbania bispinosa]|nr:1,4-dihydroxy-6-naphthoate synthase [Sesbania bispinosa]